MALSTFGRGRLWGARYGTGEPWVLALHGWGRDHHDFDPVLAGLDAVALDLPGHGVAPEPPAPWSTSEYAQWVAPALDDLGAGPVVVVGHSFGARVAVRLVEATPPVPRRRARRRPGAGGRPAGAAPRARPCAGRRSSTGPGGRCTGPGSSPKHRMERLRQKYGSEDYRRASQIMRGVLVKAVAETAQAAYVPAAAVLGQRRACRWNWCGASTIPSPPWPGAKPLWKGPAPPACRSVSPWSRGPATS